MDTPLITVLVVVLAQTRRLVVPILVMVNPLPHPLLATARPTLVLVLAVMLARAIPVLVLAITAKPTPVLVLAITARTT